MQKTESRMGKFATYVHSLPNLCCSLVISIALGVRIAFRIRATFVVTGASGPSTLEEVQVDWQCPAGQKHSAEAPGKEPRHDTPSQTCRCESHTQPH